MKQADKDALIAQVDAGLVLITSSSRPSAATINKAEKIFKGVRVACQNIPISPVTDDGGVIEPPPGPEDPPVDPPPIDPPPDGGGGGGTTEPPPTTTVTTTYTSQGDFNSVQGYRGWYYMSETEALMTYNTSGGLWQGTETYQGIWSTGQHPGATNGAMRRWISPSNGTFALTGHIFDADISAVGNNQSVTIKKNGVAIYGPQTITSGDTVGYAISIPGAVAIADEFDFIVNGVGGISNTSTNVTVSMSVTTTTSGGGTTTPTTLPFNLNGTAPQEGTYTLTANKPANADTCTISITGVNYATAYGRIYFNGSTNSMAIWPTAPGNAGISATVVLTVPVGYLINGANTLRFTHDSGSGYTVTAIAVPVFTTVATPTPPATQTSLPFILTGAILPEDGQITISVSKPSNANGCTLTVTGVNLTGLSGTYYINGTLASAIWADNPANAGVSASVARSPLHTLFVNGTNTIRFVHSEGSGYTVTALSVSFTVPAPTDPNPPAGNNGTFGNEPAGMTTLANHPFNTVAGPGMFDQYASTVIVTDPTAPLSPPNVGRHRLEAFALTGGSELYYTSPTQWRDMFVGFYWRTNAQFQGRIVMNKLFFMRGPGTNMFFGVDGGPNQQQQYFWLSGGPNTGGIDNSHLFGDPTGILNPNVGADARLTLGVWTKLEAHVRASTTRTSRDGFVKAWINGVLVISYAQLNYCGLNGETLNQFLWNETWDGHQDMGQSNTVAWEHYMDHLYISGKN